ncbi:MAG TPA: DUF3187 family protein [Gemmatimonadales bacterium]|nr:DUF3187 family protein [Gemmatimonadales bacterium]
MSKLVTALALCCGLLTPPCLGAQGLPPYAPVNPIAASRSGLASQPYLEPGRTWRIGFLTDYASLIEYADLGTRSYVLDAEVLRAELSVARNVGKHAFLIAGTSFNGSYNGFLDGFLDWYHRTTGFHVAARELRPTNEFAYEIQLPGRDYQYHASSGYLGDLRLGAGWRHSAHWQSTAWVTLPTSSAPKGYRRGTLSLNAGTTLRSAPARRISYEGTLGVGYTPTHGELADLEHTTFLMVTQGLRGRISGALHAYANLIYHSAYYQDTGMLSLDSRELSLDLGGMLRFRRGPEWIFGLTEDLEPSGPAIDVGFRLGARW